MRANRTGSGGADADGPRGRGPERGWGPGRGRDKLATGLLAGALGVFMAAGISACNTNPHAADVPPPSTVDQPAANGQSASTPSSSHHRAPKPGIQLPNTIQVFYATTPAFQDLTHHIVLWNAAQAYKAMYAAAYQPAEAATADLKRYWSGTGYQQAHAWAQEWISAKQQPVGFSVLSNVVVENLTPEQATVGFCQDLSDVVRGNVQTHTPGKALQTKDSLGDRVEYSMVPTGVKGQWQVNGQSVAPASSLCPPPDKHHHH